MPEDGEESLRELLKRLLEKASTGEFQRFELKVSVDDPAPRLEELSKRMDDLNKRIDDVQTNVRLWIRLMPILVGIIAIGVPVVIQVMASLFK